MGNAFWKTVLRLDTTRLDTSRLAPEIGIRNTIGIVLPLIAGASLGNPAAGAIAALGAANVSYSDSRDPYAVRARRMLTASALVGIAVTAGALSAHDHATAIAASALWAFGTGMMVVLGPRPGDLGTVLALTFLTFSARALTPLEAVQAGLLAFAGGLLQLLLSIALWPVRPYQPERRIIGSVYETLAAVAISPAGAESGPPATGEMILAREAVAHLGQDHSPEAERLAFLLSQAERVRLSLLALRRIRQRAAREDDSSPAVGSIDRFLVLSADILRSTGRCAAEGHGVPKLAGLGELAAEFTGAPADLRHHIVALAGQLRAVSGLSSPPLPVSSAGGYEEPPSRLARVYANLSFRSTVFRHAVRLAVCVALAGGIAAATGLQRGYWLPMTVAVVLKPDFTATFSRGILRIAGTLAGLLLATGLFRLFHSGPWTDVALMTAFALLLRYAGPMNYGIVAAAISGIAVLLVAITGVDPQSVIMARAQNTILGGGLALAAYWLWPTWERDRTGTVLGAMLRAYRAYFSAVFASSPDLERLRLACRLARTNAEASVARLAAEPVTAEAEKRSLNAILVSSHAFVRATMALEAGLNTDKPGARTPAITDYQAMTESTLSALETAILTGHAPVTGLPNLREAWQNMTERSPDTFFATETDRITTSLNTLREQIGEQASEHAGKQVEPRSARV